MNQKDTGTVVYSGFMVKSPPEKKLGAWKIFRAKWKRRFFVLSKPASSLPGQYLLSYYTDESCRRKKGQIDLEQCEQIIESLASEQFKNLLSIKTFHKHKKRTYFLATESEEDMTTWVRYLCSVCGLKQEDKPEDIPPPQPAEPSRPIPVRNPTSASHNTPSPVQTQPSYPDRGSPQACTGTLPSPGENSPYVYLNQCKTGQSVRRRESSSSIPDEPAPQPPSKDGPRNLSVISDDDPQSTYDFPKSRDSVDDGLYKVPPRRSPSQLGREDGHKYDMPPYQKGASPRSSSSESQTGDSAYSSDQMYQSPPPPRQYSPTHDRRSSDLYDSPPPPRKIIPERPPKPGPAKPSGQKSNQVSLNDKVPSNQWRESRDDTYDVPPSNSESANLLLMSPPPPTCPGNTSHRYVNANAAPIEGAVAADQNDELYLAMGENPPPQCRGSIRASNDSSYLNMEAVATAGRNSIQSNGSSVYADMSGPGKDMYADMSGGRCSSVYQIPPRPISVPTTDAPVPPPRPPATTTGYKPNTEEDTYTIFSSERTRSFKRSAVKPDVDRAAPKVSPRPNLPLPSKRGTQDTGLHHDSSSSDDDDDDDDRSIDSSVTTNSKQSGSSSLWRHPFPAPRKKAEQELKYLDLDLEDLADRESVRNPSLSGGGGTLTEYREIDFVKTQALSDTKRFVDVQRKSNTESLQ